MTLTVRVCLIVATCLWVGSCYRGVYAQSANPVVAVVNGKNITESDVDDSVTAQLHPLKEQIYALRKAALDNLVTRRILEDAARKKGISIDELKRQLTVGKVLVPPARIEQEYAEHESVFGMMSPDEAKERLRLDFENQERMALYRNALADLRKSASIDLRLEEPRLSALSVDASTAPSTGSKDTDAITIIEFSDFQCPYCRESQGTLKEVMRAYGAKAKLVFKHLPLDLHAEAFASARAAFCAGEQGFFWQYQDALFSSPDLSAESLNKIAKNLGLRQPQFQTCVNSEASRAVVLRDLQEAKRLGINSTPTFIINGRVYRGAPSLEEFQAVIQRELKTAQNTSFSKQE